MIAVDTSALMAIALGEGDFNGLIDVLEAETDVVISAGTVAEALIVAGRRNVSASMAALIEGLALTIIPLTAATARGVALAYARWGKGIHPAGLNLGDCFAYAVAKDHNCPLLFVGDDFSRTDLVDARTA